jgi:hypothetical protein
MLSVVAAIALSQLSKDQALAKRLIDEADKIGWTVTVQTGSHPRSVNEVLMKDGFVIRFEIDVQPSRAKARAAATDMADSEMVTTLDPRVPFDEPLLHGTGLKVDVPDYKNKRIRSMKRYALSNMRVIGVVKRSAVCISALHDNHPVTYKTDDKVYDGLIGLIKMMVQELKKK